MTAFVVAFALTVVLLGIAVALGFLRKRKTHVAFVLATVGALGVTIYYAYELGKIRDLAAAGWITPFHLTLAKVTTAALLLPVVTGLRVWNHPEAKPLHRKFAYLALGLVVASAITGFWMISRSPAK